MVQELPEHPVGTQRGSWGNGAHIKRLTASICTAVVYVRCVCLWLCKWPVCLHMLILVVCVSERYSGPESLCHSVLYRTVLHPTVLYCTVRILIVWHIVWRCFQHRWPGSEGWRSNCLIARSAWRSCVALQNSHAVRAESHGQDAVWGCIMKHSSGSNCTNDLDSQILCITSSVVVISQRLKLSCLSTKRSG
jgi:hypothetical protein